MTQDDIKLKFIKDTLMKCDDKTFRQAVCQLIETVASLDITIDELVDNYHAIANVLEKSGLATIKRHVTPPSTTEE
jgi:hypothetical protein